MMEMRDELIDKLDNSGLVRSRNIGIYLEFMTSLIDRLSTSISDDEHMIIDIGREGGSIYVFMDDKFKRDLCIAIVKEGDEWKILTFESQMDIIRHLADSYKDDNE